MGAVLGGPWITMGTTTPGPAKNRPWSHLFAETPNYRGLGVAMRGRDEFRLAFRTDVLPRATRRPSAQGARDRPGGRPGRIAGPPIVHRWNRCSDAASPHTPRHHPFVPVPQHVRLPDLRTVQRAAAGHRPAPGVTDGSASAGPVRLRGVAERSAVGRRRGTSPKESLASWVEAHGGTADPDNLHLADASVDLSAPPDGRSAPPWRGREGRCGHGDRRQLQSGDQPRASVDRGRPDVAAGRRRRDTNNHSVHVLVRPDSVRRLPVRRGLATGPRRRPSSTVATDQRAIQIFSEDGAYNNEGTTLTYEGKCRRHSRRLCRRRR